MVNPIAVKPALTDILSDQQAVKNLVVAVAK